MISQRYNEQMGNYLAKLAKASKPQTNADRIRSMSDEELSAFICRIRNSNVPLWCDYKKCETRKSCGVCRLDWLKLEGE